MDRWTTEVVSESYKCYKIVICQNVFLRSILSQRINPGLLYDGNRFFILKVSKLVKKFSPKIFNIISFLT